MGLFGALFAGVSGLDSQSNKIGIISNNISNVNTIGYKQGSAAFDTLVVPSGTTSFSPGGVIGNTQQLVNQQGIISATTSPTDVAISGAGFFVVNTKADGTGQTLYTRSGSFTQDSQGNFINADGYYLQGLPINTTTGSAEQANAQNLKTVSINQSASGAATATSLLTLAANLNATQAVLAGPGETTGINAGIDTTNYNNTGAQIIAATGPTSTGGNGLVAGDKIQLSSVGTNGTVTDTFTYGGYVSGRNINTGVPATTDTTNTDVLIQGTGAGNVTGALTATAGSTTVSVNVGATNAAHYSVGGTISISGVTGTDASEINGEWKVTSITGSTVTFTTATNVTTGGTEPGAINATNRTYNFSGNVLQSNTDSGDFLANVGTSPFAADATEFTITNSGTGVTTTYTYNSVPNTTQNQFNSLTTLAQAISNTAGLTASVVSHQLVVSATDANNGLTFANVDSAGNATLAGINWVQELGLQNIAATPTSGAGSLNMFNSLSGLAAKVNSVDPINLTATVNNPTSATPTLSLFEANPLQTIQISDNIGNTGSSLVNELSLKGPNGSALTQVSGGATNTLTTGILAATYDPIDPARNMSSGSVGAQYSKDITVYDAQGNSHTLALNFAKLNTNTWAVEATAVPASDVLPAGSDGQVAYGTLTFNGSGGLISATGSIAATGGFTVNWSNGAASSTVTANLGVGGSTGIIQTAGAFNFSTANQNGSPVGELTGVNVDASGNVIASFSNGQTQKIFQIPLAAVANPDGLEGVSGDAYIQTIASGIANLELAGTSGVGTFTPSALEQSNVDLSTQLTDLIVAQQAYGANSKLLTVSDQLLQQLDQIIQ